MSDTHDSKTYWKQSLKIIAFLLMIWAFVSFGCGIIFREYLDAEMPSVGGAPFGFWMAQQGSIIVFVLLLFVYNRLMNKLDRKHGYDQEGSL
ncbi:MAG: DUF4212 domain-containing protein [Methylococcales bacterium]|jgi:putative solute:sodium symporter small subunit|nr:DUF4212 domain-containing protein [Methylococcaceae bacterium]